MKDVSQIIAKLKRSYPELSEEPLLDQLELAAGPAPEDAEAPMDENAYGDEDPDWELPPEDAYEGPEDELEAEEAPAPKAKRKPRMPF